MNSKDNAIHSDFKKSNVFQIFIMCQFLIDMRDLSSIFHIIDDKTENCPTNVWLEVHKNTGCHQSSQPKLLTEAALSGEAPPELT